MALDLFLAGAAGLAWWSTLEAYWTNLTIFEERLAAVDRRIASVEPLSLVHPAVREAAEHLLIELPRPRLRRLP
jgi:hypothetical protein